MEDPSQKGRDVGPEDEATLVDRLIRQHGNRAYDMAVESIVIAEMLGDRVGTKLYAEAAEKLLKRGYRPKGAR